MKVRILLFVCMSLFLMTLCCRVTKAASNHTVRFNSSNINGGAAIQKVLDLQKGKKPKYSNLIVVIEPGVYDFTSYLLVYSNTTINATGATINYKRVNGVGDGRNPIIFNDASSCSGYTGASHISIIGGTWDFQGTKGQVMYGKTLEGFRFMHCKDITIKDVVMQNIYSSHLLTLEGVDGANISGCIFKDQTNMSIKKEAIHLDIMHNSSCAPSSQINIRYDDSFCKNIDISECSFYNVPRGVGSHLAVKGCYPDNIRIANCNFDKIKYEAIKGYAYKNFTVENNYISGSMMGIKAYVYVKDGKNPAYLEPNSGIVLEEVPENMNVVIENNVITDFREGSSYGIHLQGCADRVYSGVKVIGNSITGSPSNGIYVKHCKGVLLEGNTVNNSGKNGISCNNTANITISSNNCEKPNNHGIYVEKCKGYTNVTFNSVQSVPSSGIVTKNCPEVNVKFNNISENVKSGISICAGCKGAVVEQNSINESKTNAVNVTGVDSVSVLNNTVYNSGVHGINVNKCSNVKVNSNNIDSTSTGIFFGNSSKSSAKSNYVINTKGYKVYFTSSCTDRKNVK